MAAPVLELSTANERHSSKSSHNDDPIRDPEKLVHTEDATDEEPGSAPARTPPELQKWNQTPADVFRFLATIYCFILMGMTDGAVGALLPYIETYYTITYTTVSLLFLSPFVGYLLAALLNTSSASSRSVRDAEPFIAGLTVTFFWLGLTIGRVALGFVTGRIGEKLAITVYLLLSIVLQLLYWLVPNFEASATFVAFLGFFLGPLFPAAIVAATKLLPSDYHVSAIGFAAAFGGGGAALFPFAVGAIAQKKGVEVLQPIVLAILVFIQLMWWLLPGGLRMGGLEKARENGDKVGDNFKKSAGWVKGKMRQKTA
ncbi:hypothetical protein N0V88_000444 [Collariella sp. IMI 366227]|nr:hypothetical protein N0V88_000444 [Collariella sp. IMI 366227]